MINAKTSGPDWRRKHLFFFFCFFFFYSQLSYHQSANELIQLILTKSVNLALTRYQLTNRVNFSDRKVRFELTEFE